MRLAFYWVFELLWSMLKVDSIVENYVSELQIALVQSIRELSHYTRDGEAVMNEESLLIA